jgi:hypothetical protein
MLPQARSTHILVLLALSLLLTTGCDRARLLPTAVTPSHGDQGPAATARAARGESVPGDTRRVATYWPDHAVIPEAREALGAILTGEQVYLQKFGTFTDAADTSEIRALLGVHLEEPSRHWVFSVTGASAAGFVASARGRVNTEAAGFIVTLGYVRGHPPTSEIHRTTATLRVTVRPADSNRTT